MLTLETSTQIRALQARTPFIRFILTLKKPQINGLKSILDNPNIVYILKHIKHHHAS